LALKGGNQVRLLSRNSKDLGAKFPEIMVSIVELNAQGGVWRPPPEALLVAALKTIGSPLKARRNGVPVDLPENTSLKEIRKSRKPKISWPKSTKGVT
jgi:hypothetical protein